MGLHLRKRAAPESGPSLGRKHPKGAVAAITTDAAVQRMTLPWVKCNLQEYDDADQRLAVSRGWFSAGEWRKRFPGSHLETPRQAEDRPDPGLDPATGPAAGSNETITAVPQL